MKSLIIGTLLLVGCFGAARPAAAISCVGAGDVSVLAGGCDLGFLHVSDFSMSAQGFLATVFLAGAPFTTPPGTLGFQVAHTPPVALADILLSFSIHSLGGALTSLALSNGGTGVVINERVCATPFVGSSCVSGLLANLIADPNEVEAVTFTPGLETIYILKDITFGQNGFLSDFAQAVSTGGEINPLLPPLEPIPEPSTLLLVGTSLAGLGLWWRRRGARP
jgi:hypothetical protein